MTPEQYKQFEETMRATVEKSASDAIRLTVNGKIDRLNDKLDNYIKKDNEWKEQAQPTIDMGNNARGFGLVFMKILGVLSVAGGLYLAVKEIFKQ